MKYTPENSRLRGYEPKKHPIEKENLPSTSNFLGFKILHPWSLTASLPLKNSSWKTFLLGFGNFSMGKLAVKVQGGNFPGKVYKPYPFSQNHESGKFVYLQY